MKNYLRFLSPVMLLLMAVMFGGGKILAQNSETYNFTSFDQQNEVTFKGKDCTITFKKNNGSTAPQWSSNQARLYPKGSLIVSSTKKITSIVYHYVVNKNKKGNKPSISSVTPDGFSESSKTWSSETGSNNVVMTLGGSAGNFGFTSLDITYEDDGKTQTTLSFPTPSYTYEVGQDNGTVIIDNNAAVLKDKEGNVISDATGKITYSVESSVTDLAILGSDENSSDIIVNTNNAGTATVTATFAGDDTYAASKASYTINVITIIPTIADLKQQLDNNDKTFTLKLTDAVVSYVYGDRAYLEDASAGILVFLKGSQTLVAGQKFNGLVEVAAQTWHNLPEITSWTASPSMTTETVTELPLEVVTVEELKNNYKKYEGRRVKVLGVTITKIFTSDDLSGEITQNGLSITLRAGDNPIETTLNDIVNVIGFPTIYNTGKQLAIWEQSAIDVIKTEALTTSAGGYATYSADYAVNYSELGLTAYTLTVDETNKTVTAKAFTGVVPAGGAVLVKGAASTTYTLTPATTEGDATFATDLQTGATTADGTQYGFTSKSGTPAFAQVQSGQNIPAKKGYIVLKGASAAKYSICFDDEATGIQTIEAASAANDAMYNLAGQRVDKAYKGIVIVNGKKYLNK